MNEFTRVFAPELEVRSSAEGGDGRTIEGLCVPYNTRQRINAELAEQFAPGAFAHQFGSAARIKLGRDHDTIIGRAIELRDDKAGLWGAFRVSDTPAGNETLELVKDGALDELSVGFRERQNRTMSDGTIERVKADLVEVSVVVAGAYGRNALVTAVRERENLCVECAARLPRERASEAAQILARIPTLPI